MYVPHGRKIPIPRPLEVKETAASLRLWKVNFQNYYKTDVNFKMFVMEDTRWHVNRDNWGFAAEPETSQLKRTPAELKSDCNMFLETLASFVPSDYLVEKITKNTSSIATIWTILDDYYGTTLNSETYLGLTKMQKHQSETYRQFYLRLEGFVSKHLTKGNVKVEEVTSPARGDTMTISIRNLLVIIWLTKIHDKLVDCVKVDFSQDLRNGTELSQLMPRIADNVDSILSRHDLSSGVSAISVSEELDGDTSKVHHIGGSRGGARGGARSRGGRRDGRGGRQPVNTGPGKQLHCSHCEYLSQTLRLKINTKHEPSECWRKEIAVRLIKTEEDSAEDFSSAEDYGEHMDKFSSKFNYSHLLQIKAGHEGDGSRDVSSVDASPPPSPEIQTPLLSDNQDKFHQILKIQRSLLNQEVGTAQAKSPSLLVTIHGHKIPATIDEGSELNCINYNLTKKCSLEITGTENKARAADSSRLRLVGQLKKPLLLVAEPHGTPIRLKHVVVVENLNASLLIGEPGKRDNDIITYSAKKEISIPFKQERHVFPYHQGPGPAPKVARVSSSSVTYPGENFFWKVPEMYSHLSHLQIQPRHSCRHWFKPNTCQVQDGHVCLKNTSESPVYLKRGTAFADVTMVRKEADPILDWKQLRDSVPDQVEGDETDMTGPPPYPGTSVFLTDTLADIAEHSSEEAPIGAVYTTYPDQNQYVQSGDTVKVFKDHTDEIQLDPDNVLTAEQRTAFRDLCQEFKDVIRPEPGRYNGSYGHISNRINFASRPAPNAKIYQQNLSEPLKRQLGDKMDKLMSWNVMAFPEKVGVKPEFISPSMLVPKSEKGEFRLVTNFSSLNKFIIKPRGTSPTIQEAKDFLARHKYHVHLDLSNFFHQGGMEREDIQFLGTVHPYRGIVVYTCEAQGINGAAEHSYERITRIFSDFFKEGTMTRMADGLHIGCNSAEEGLSTLKAVLTRARDTGLTFKPSKIEVFPVKTVLFGWVLNNGLWAPTSHTTSALAKAPLPKTVKQLRGFLGSFKQFTQCVQRYGELLTQLESMTGSHIPSAEKIQWTPEQEAAFNAARDATKDIKAYAIPRPDDKIFTYSDFSRAHRAVGGKMEFERVMEDGSVRRFLGGYFSTMVDSFKSLWWPCEGEALSVRLVLQFFERYIRASNQSSVHFTDNQPVVDAWKKARRGGFSTNARISTFLSEVSNFPTEIRHKAGHLMHTSDFASRHPQTCPDKSCSLCKFVYDEQMVGDNCDEVRYISVEEITSGAVTMPFTARKAWLDVQRDDKVHIQLKYLVSVGQEPAKKQTKGDNNKLKLLYNLYKRGDLRIESDGLVTVKQTNQNKVTWVPSIPYKLFPGLSQAIHLKLNHPSKNQQTQLMARFFYSPGHQTMIESTVDSCSQCLSMKTLPKVIQEHKATPVQALGARFSSDVMMRNGQKFLVTVEDQSSFTFIDEVPDQSAEVLKEKLLSQVVPIMPESGTEIRTDGGSSFKSIEMEANTPGSMLKKMNVKIDIGERFNPNKNARAENKIKEVEKEFLRHFPSKQKLSPLDVIEVTKSINSRIRSNGLASREILLSRKLITNELMDLTDRDLAMEKKNSRDEKNSKFRSQQERAGLKAPPMEHHKVGDLVYLRSEGDKNHTRSLYIIHQVDTINGMASVKKYEHQLQAKNYNVKISDLISHSTFRGPPKSADMSKKELEKDEENNVILNKRKETEKSSERKGREIVQKAEKVKPAGKKGAPNNSHLNASGRPMRRAAAKHKYATVYNVASFPEIKPPWLQENQFSEDEDDDFWSWDPDILWSHWEEEPQLIEAEEDHDLEVEQVLAIVQAPEAILPLDTDSESVTDTDQAEERGAAATAESSTSDGSEYYDIVPSTPKPPLEEDYNWDNYTETPSFSDTSPDLSFQIPRDWPPRRLSSEYSSQMIVTQLAPTSSDFDLYFEDAAFRDNELLAGPSVITSQEAYLNPRLPSLSPVNAVPAVSPLHSQTEENEANSPAISEPKKSTPESQSIQLEAGNPTEDQPPGPRQSERIKASKKPDYRSLNSRGRTGSF